MEECGSGIREIDNDPEVNVNLIPILKEALNNVDRMFILNGEYVYKSEKWMLIVKRHDDHEPVYQINKWGYGKIYFYVPYRVRNVKAYLRGQIKKEIRRIRRLHREFCEKKEGEKGMENPGGEKYGVFQ
ncbi:MAG: hypothetical protein QXV17_15040 [Candidatus Micrarchaeaceae archaeon]